LTSEIIPPLKYLKRNNHSLSLQNVKRKLEDNIANSVFSAGRSDIRVKKHYLGTILKTRLFLLFSWISTGSLLLLKSDISVIKHLPFMTFKSRS
jgi:hypothetical protein